jgi:hypothetical protein
LVAGGEGLERGTAILRWHVQCELSATTRDAVLARASLRTLEQARLFGWFSNRERALSVYDAFTLAFPELAIRPWELPGQVPRGYWELGGDEARAQAMRWWLERLGLSAHEVLAQLETRARGVERQLRAAGLGDLAHDRGLRALLHLVDPTIPIEPPPSQRQRERDEATLACPRCGRRVRSLALHLGAAHPELSREEREELLERHGRLSPVTLARYEAAGLAPLGDVARWRKVGLAIPVGWWPMDEPGVALALVDGPDGPLLQLAPAAQSRRRLRRNGRWWELRVPLRVQRASAVAPVVRVEDGVRLGPLDEEGTAVVRGWLGRGATKWEEQ